MKSLMRILAAAALTVSWVTPGQAQVVEKKGLTLEGARQIIATAIGEARRVKAPLIRECHANLECRLADDRLVDRYNFFIFEVVKAHVATAPQHPRVRR